MSMAIELSERGLLPDVLVRFGMRRLMAARLREESLDRGEAEYQRFSQRLAELRRSPIAVDTDRANEQHYEVPAGFFSAALGPHLKYSCCLYPPGITDLGAAEEAMLALTCERAGLADGQDVLELGCGWGSLSLWMASRYPASRITSVSNSASQREYILGQARQRGLANLDVVTADANVYDTAQRFDRVVSVEMFEHMRNYASLMARIGTWLRPGGRLFVHIFCHRSLMYPFTTGDDYDWMARHFFTGGLMPAEDTLLWFQDDLAIEAQWRVSGVHYQKTAEAWLLNLDRNRAAAREALATAAPPDGVERALNRWRMFFMAVAELFGYAGGTEWLVGHYRFLKRA